MNEARDIIIVGVYIAVSTQCIQVDPKRLKRTKMVDRRTWISRTKHLRISVVSVKTREKIKKKGKMLSKISAEKRREQAAEKEGYAGRA